MHFNTIKNIDYWIGRPVCGIFTFFNYVKRKFIPYNYRSPKKILFIKLIEQGATVLAYSSIKKAVHTIGKENVYFLVFRENRPILDIINMLPEENIIEIDHSSLVLFLLTAARALVKIRRYQIDSTADMEFFSRASVIIALMSGARNRAGLHRYNSEQPYRGDLMTHKIQYNPYLHCSMSYYLLVESLFTSPTEIPLQKISFDRYTIEIPEYKPERAVTEKLRSSIDAALHLSFTKIILLNPNASDMLPLRKWELHKFVELSKKILDHTTDAIIIVTGGKTEASHAEKLCLEVNSDRMISLAGKTTLSELMHLYTMSEILITNDSGPAHFASMTDCTIIVLFGPETPQLFSPLSRKQHIIWKRLACSPCVNVFNHRMSPCNDNVCMQQINVEEVFEKVKLSFTASSKIQLPVQ
jgi:ADP-heptose:LPS heptosyltransferase